MKEPTVTIVVSAHERLSYLKEALSSALHQTYENFELILSDDSSSDEIASYAAFLGDPRIRYRRNKQNLGIAMNNFAAFSEARGKYIANLHDDDAWEPGFLAALVPPLEADDKISVAFCDHHIMDEEGRLLPDRTKRNSRFYRRHLLKPGRLQPSIKSVVIDQTIPMVMAAVFRKSILEGVVYSRRIGGSYDYWLAYLAVRDGKACYYVPQRLTRYRVHKNSGTASRGVKNMRENIYVYRQLLTDAKLSPYRGRLLNSLGILYGKMALYYFKQHSSRRGRILLKKAFSLLNRPKNILALAANTILASCREKLR